LGFRLENNVSVVLCPECLLKISAGMLKRTHSATALLAWREEMQLVDAVAARTLQPWRDPSAAGEQQQVRLCAFI